MTCYPCLLLQAILLGAVIGAVIATINAVIASQFTGWAWYGLEQENVTSADYTGVESFDYNPAAVWIEAWLAWPWVLYRWTSPVPTAATPIDTLSVNTDVLEGYPPSSPGDGTYGNVTAAPE